MAKNKLNKEELLSEDAKQKIDVLKICVAPFIANRDFSSADDYYLEILSIDPEDYDAYLGLLLVDTRTANTDELFNYFSKQDIDPVTKISSRINDLYVKQHESRGGINQNKYQRFNFHNYRTIQNLFDEYSINKEQEYLSLIDTYNETDDVETLNELIESFTKLEGYKESKKYIARCKDKINKVDEDKKENEYKDKIANLLEIANDFLLAEDYDLADEYYSEVLQLDPENIDAYLGILMVDTKTSNEEELFDYYKNLYVEDETEILDAVKKDHNHINEMIDKYSIPGYLDSNTIRQYYDYDTSYISVLNSRKKARDNFYNYIKTNPLIVSLKRLNNKELNDKFKEIRLFYDDRYKVAKKEDKENINRISSAYQRHIFDTYRKVQNIYDEYNEKRQQEYLSLIDTYNETDDVETLNELIESFTKLEGYKESKKYIARCKDKINKVDEDKKENEYKDKIANLLEIANDFLLAEDYDLADEYYSEVLQLDPENIDAYLGILMVDTKTSNEEELFDYYKNLYVEDETEILDAVKKDHNHINEMIDKYSIPGYLDSNTIRQYYDYDTSYVSVLNSRKRNRDNLLKEFELNPLLVKIAEIDKEKYKEILAHVVEPYTEKINEATALDQNSINKVFEEYNHFSDEVDKKIIKQYNSYSGKKPAKKQEKIAQEPKVQELKKPEVKKTETKKEKVKVPKLDETYYLLAQGDYQKARENLTTIIKNDPDNADAYLGMLMIETKTKNLDDLFDYYKNLYKKDSVETLEAVAQDNKHINEIANKYAIKGILDKKDIIDRYTSFDRTYDSVLSSRTKNKHALLNTIYNNNNFINLDRLDDQEVAVELEKVVSVYNDRINKAQLADEAKIEKISNDYHDFLINTDNEILELYQNNQKEVETLKVQRKAKRKKLFAGLFVTLFVLGLLAVGGYFAYTKVIVPSNQYKQAVALAEDDKFEEAIEIFKELGSYKDCEFKVEETYYNMALKKYSNGENIEAINILKGLSYEGSKEKIQEIKDVINKEITLGSTFVFGNVEQDGDTSNGREIIVWKVIALEEDRALLISENVIDALRYDNTEEENIDWETSNIRFLLNGKFPDNAFDQEKPSRILPTTITSYRYDEDGDREEYETEDRLFLLSAEELDEYFASEQDRTTKATERVKEKDIMVEANGDCGWWLRSVGEESRTAEYVWGSNGTIATSVMEVFQGVRPAMWISIEE